MTTETYTPDELAEFLGYPPGTEIKFVRDPNMDARIEEWISEAREMKDPDLLHELIKAREAPFWRGFDRAIEDVELTEGQLHIVQCEADNVLDVFRGSDGPMVSAEDLELIGERFTSGIVREPLRIKVLRGMYAEHRVQDTVPVDDGIVGRAVDEAVETLKPYMQGWNGPSID